MIELRDVDLGVEPELHEWYDVWAAAQTGRPQELVTPWAVARESMPRTHPDFEVTLFTAYDDRVPVGAGRSTSPPARRAGQRWTSRSPWRSVTTASRWSRARCLGEQRRADAGASVVTALALAPDGTVVGSNDVVVSTHDPRVGYVGITLVLPDHRGHRLGLATKLASHRAVRAAHPDCRYVKTSNAEANAHMNAINDALGYRTLETLLEHHRTI